MLSDAEKAAIRDRYKTLTDNLPGFRPRAAQRQMLAEMRKATRTLSGPDGLFANPVNRDMLDIADTAVADSLARSRQFGLADMIVRDLLGEPLKNAGGAVALNQQAHADGAALAAFAPPLRAPFNRTQESHTDAHDQ